MVKYKFTPENITKLKDNEIFVFGSNKLGRHGKGAAKTAMALFGAQYGVGEGFTGKCYAIPTKDERLRTLSLVQIEGYFKKFIEAVQSHPDKTFLLTKIGMGLAGLTVDEIAPIVFKFEPLPKNLVIPLEIHRWKYPF